MTGCPSLPESALGTLVSVSVLIECMGVTLPWDPMEDHGGHKSFLLNACSYNDDRI